MWLRAEPPKIAPMSTELWPAFVAMATLNASLYAVFAGSARKLLASPRARRRFNRVGGSLLSAAGVWALTARRSA